MDVVAEKLRKKLDDLLQQAANVAVELARTQDAMASVPHYSVIESQAHQTGRRLSCHIQAQQMNALAASQHATAKCPACGARSELAPEKRTVASIDGAVELQELKGYCACCRRSFFPAA